MTADRHHPSPNHTERRGTDAPDMIVLHYTGMESAQAALVRLSDPAAEVSAHYLVTRMGEIVSLVDETRRAWHAGRAAWGAVEDVNSHSVGIEIDHPGHMLGYPPFPDAQIAATIGLIRAIRARWRIPPERVVGHACVAPGRKIDPGEKFDWRRLSLEGCAVWLDAEDAPRTTASADASAFQAAARMIGYGCPQTGAWDRETFAVWQAFTMRFLPGRTKRAPDATGIAHARRLAERWPVAAGG